MTYWWWRAGLLRLAMHYRWLQLTDRKRQAMGRHTSDTGNSRGVPSTGDGRTRSRGRIQKTETAVRNGDGGIMWKATAKLFGIMGNRNSGRK